MWPALLLALCALLDLVIPHPAGVARAEFGTSFAGTIVAIGAGLIGLFSGKIDKNVKTALDGMRLTLRVALEAMADFGQEAGTEQSKAVGSVGRILGIVVLGLIHGVDSGIRGLHDWLKRTLGPILRALQKFRTLFLQFYDKWFKPIFDTLDVIRHVLGVLSFLHVGFAQKADQAISDLEARLRRLILIPLQKINQVIDQVTLVIDEFGFYQQYTLLRSMAKYAVDSWNVLLHPQLAGVDPDVNATKKAQRYPAIDAPTLAGELSEYYTAGGGALAPTIDQAALVWHASAVSR